MNPIKFILRRPIRTFLFVICLAAASLLILEQRGVDVLRHVDTSRISALFDQVASGAEKKEHESAAHEGQQDIVVTSPIARDVVITEPFVCQIHSQRHIDVRALERGYLQEILVREGQAVKKGDVMFRIMPVLYEARLDAEKAEARLAQLEYNNTKRLATTNLPVVSLNEVALLEAKLAKAQAKAQLAQAELDFTSVKAPFDGIVDRLREQLGSLVDEGDVLTTLSDNSLMWVYFNVPEARYLEYMADRQQNRENDRVQLKLANGTIFPQAGKIGAIEAKFDNTTGNIPFRADFPNPSGLLRHGQTGTILLSRVHKGAIVIPQRAVFDVLDKHYVYVVDEDHVVHQRPISIEHVLDDIYLIDKGLELNDKIVLEGVRQVRDGATIEFEFTSPEKVLENQKYRAE